MPYLARCFVICLWMGVLVHPTVHAAVRVARTFDFEPTQFHGLFGAAKPALNISPGDTVRTWTLDAEGFDSHGVRRIALVNPQTGPFYVETAMPGDTLAIHFVKIRANRSTADMYGDALAANALEPYSLRRETPAAKGSSSLDSGHGARHGEAHPADSEAEAFRGAAAAHVGVRRCCARVRSVISNREPGCVRWQS